MYNIITNNILTNHNYQLLINILLLFYLSLAPIYILPIIGTITLYKNILFIIILLLSLPKITLNNIFNIGFIIFFIFILLANTIFNTSLNGIFKLYYNFLIPISIVYIIYNNNSLKYIKYSIYPITIYCIIYIILSYNINLINYDIRTNSFGMLSTNWSILLSIYAIYSVKIKLNPIFTIIIFFAQLLSGGRCGILTSIIGCFSIYILNKNYKIIIFPLIILISYQLIKPNVYMNLNVNRDYIFFNMDGGWSYLLHSHQQTKTRGIKTLSDLNYDIDANIDTFYFLKKSDIEYDIKNNGKTSNVKAPSSFSIKNDKDIVVPKRNDTILLFLDNLISFRIQQNLLAIKLFMEKPFGRNFDDAGEIIVYPNFLMYYQSKEALNTHHLYQIHNVFFYNAVRGGIAMIALLISLFIFVFYIPKNEDKIFLFSCMIPMFFESSIIFGNYNQCLIWWIVFASYYNNKSILRVPLFTDKNILR